MPKIVDHDERRTSIAQAAWRPIAEKGVHKTTLREIAEEVGCTTGLLANYFDSKEALLHASLELVVDQTLERVAQCAPKTIDEMLDFLDLLLPTSSDRALEWRVWMWFWAHALGDPTLAERNRRLHEIGRELIERAIHGLQQAGTISPETDVEAMAVKIYQAVNGLGLDATLDTKVWPARRQREHLVSTINDLLPAVRENA